MIAICVKRSFDCEKLSTKYRNKIKSFSTPIQSPTPHDHFLPASFSCHISSSWMSHFTNSCFGNLCSAKEARVRNAKEQNREICHFTPMSPRVLSGKQTIDNFCQNRQLLWMRHQALIWFLDQKTGLKKHMAANDRLRNRISGHANLSCITRCPLSLNTSLNIVFS